MSKKIRSVSITHLGYKIGITKQFGILCATRTHETIGITNQSTRIHGHGCNYKNFSECHPKPFNGKKDAIATLQWITSMEAVIKMSECRSDQSVKFVAHSFEEEALD
ncbi:hypothetical protein L1987_20824 [Smallanthus sonchifolius]|uniref:Uncharacterized protein n=1 Tax=Smallanthus sonchifolius TaxID=185202 RepID=A0ACB9ITV5_9ASTR|nr:hypothetical protein L1987_20824 [Smallanthus sonchifolius]